MARLFIGTSGWVYRSWKGPFYPEDSREPPLFGILRTGVFDTTEINSSFYHLPRPQTFTTGLRHVPSDFIFSVKASRFLTHMKRLLDPSRPWERFSRARFKLDKRLGPILLQFPPAFSKDPIAFEPFST